MRFGNINEGEPENYQTTARTLVALTHNEDAGTDEITTEEVYVIWFNKTLQNWKAILSTTVPNNKIYEVTHDGDKDQTYVDGYVKETNRVFNQNLEITEFNQN